MKIEEGTEVVERVTLPERLREWVEKDVDEQVRQVRFTNPDTDETNTFGDVANDFAFGMSEEAAQEYVQWLNRIPYLSEQARDILADINWVAGKRI